MTLVSVLTTALTFIVAMLAISLLILVHELGHFLAGRALGFRILEFSMGMGPVLWKREKNGVVYALRALPIGGMCRFYGEDEEVKAPGWPGFADHPVWKRMLVVLTGPIMNMLVAVLLAIAALVAYGDYVPKIYAFAEGRSPARDAGMQVGDVIHSVDGKRITYLNETTALITGADPDEVIVTVERGGELLDFTMRNIYNQEAGRNMIGISMTAERKSFGLLEAAGFSVSYIWGIVVETFRSLAGLFRGETSLNDMGSIVQIVDMLMTAVRTSFESLLRLLTLVCASLGVFNLLPLPALDGGRFAFMLVEAVRGKPVPPEKEGMVHFVGMVLLMGLMAVLVTNDIIKLFGG